jgi:tetratricopeptide (TPR) repeat protein
VTTAVSDKNDHAWRSHAVAVIVLLVATVAVFGRVATFALLEWDDQLHLTQNPYLQPSEADRYSHFWREPYGKLFVPITYNLWAALYAHCFDSAGGFSPRLLHEANVVAHGVAVLLAYVLLLRLLRDRASAPVLGATIGAAFFALHPLQVEPVAWISELRGLLAADFALAAMVVYFWALRARPVVHVSEHSFIQAGTNDSTQPWRPAAIIVSALLLGAATLCKPSVAAVPAMMFVIDVAWLRQSWRRAIVGVLPQLAIAVATLVLMRTLQSGGVAAESLLWRRPLIAGDAVAFYVGRVFWPFDLCADYSRTPTLVAKQTWFWFAWLVPVAMAILLAGWRSRAAITAGGLFVLALLPVSGIVPFEFQRISTVADRYAYLALLGPAFGVAIVVARWGAEQRYAAGAAGLVLMALLAWRSIDQLASWRDDRALWRHAADVNPQALVALCNIADEQAKHGDRAEARSTLTRVLSIEPAHPSAHFGLGSLADDDGDINGAVVWYLKAETANPGDAATAATANDGAGLVLARAGRRTEAETHFRRAIQAEPEFALGWNDLGALLLELNRNDEARTAFERALKIRPGHSLALQNLATACERVGDAHGAEAALGEAIRRQPRDQQILRRLADRAMAAQQWDAAIGYWGRLLAVSPGDVDALNERGQALAVSGKVDEAIADFERAIALRPDLKALQENLAAARQLKAARPR